MRKEVVRRFLNKLDKRKIIFDEMEGKVLWFIPPPDSKGKSVKEIAKETGFSLIQVLEIIKRLADLGLVELMNT
jgi:Mn-dependent DtxR family transcriptional regulator